MSRPDPGSRAGGTCRGCGHGPLAEVVDLGDLPEANTFPDLEVPGSGDPRWPLRVLACERCWLVQLDRSGPPEAALPGPPAYDLSETMRDHARRFVDDVLGRLSSPPGELRVVELASHATYLRPFLVERGVRSLIVEGSPPLAEAEARAGHAVLARPFGEAAARELVADAGPVDLVLDNYLLAHVPDPDDFAAGLATLLRPGGLAVLEFDHLLRLMADCRFDAFRHGHFTYLSLTAVRTLLERHGLAVFDVAPQPVYGGTLRAFIGRAGDGAHPVSEQVRATVDAEHGAGLASPAAYRRFARRVDEARRALRTFLEARRAEGAVVAGYGAPSRATTLLNVCGITTELLPWTVDRSPLKQGRRMPGTDIPILDPGVIFERRPDDVLVLTWDIRDEVTRQLAGIDAWGGRFVVPLPRLAVLP